MKILKVENSSLLAQGAAILRAQKRSRTEAARRVLFTDAWQPAEGGPAFAVQMQVDGWAVVELTDVELAERIRLGRQRRIDELLALADKARDRAQQLLGSDFADRHTADERALRLEAEALEDDITQPITSPERDTRPAEAP